MTEYRVAFDAGRPDGRACIHLGELVSPGDPAVRGCSECLESGKRWLHLRQCLSCGHVGCCDSSRGKHAQDHAESSGHPVARSIERGEDWAWCYADELFLTPNGGPGMAT
ncbi:UBP-type zinc finger domain-containing protein [Streptomyces sp. NBC_01104]|nr:UBP-type zinc finger domain-containing protein [Streptomyces sp. NBC_01104]